ncbi:MAG: hypothetical protein M1831_003398 [Alyxoria varia]|nr:MAG: hypothetical protein M1831_003398 [Alyxoria varia]
MIIEGEFLTAQIRAKQASNNFKRNRRTLAARQRPPVRTRDSFRNRLQPGLYPFKQSTLAKLRETVNDLRGNLILAVQIAELNISQRTSGGVCRLNIQQDDKERQSILDWLSSADYAKRHYEFRLFFVLDPGVGKTFITCIVIEYLQSQFRLDPRSGICYIYCNYKRPQQQNLGCLLASILQHLVWRLEFVPESLRQLYRHHYERKSTPSTSEYVHALKAIASNFSSILLIVDALDECVSEDGAQDKFLQQAWSLQSTMPLKLFVTSRFVPRICEQFQGNLQREIRADEGDILRYIEKRVSELPRCVARDANLQLKVNSAVLEAVDGMFLLAKLHLDSLYDKTNPRRVEDALKHLAKGKEALNPSYQSAKERIENKSKGFRDLAKRKFFDERNIDETEEILSCCAGPAVIESATNTVRLVQYTAQEYFEGVRDSWLPRGRSMITGAYLTFLSYDVSAPCGCKNNQVFGTVHRSPGCSFGTLAARQWGFHAHMTPIEDWEGLAINFLMDDGKVAIAFELLKEARLLVPFYSVCGVNGLHLVAFLGLLKLIAALLGQGIVPDRKDRCSHTPLGWAAYRRHEAVVKVLLECDQVNPNNQDLDGNTPLHHAIDFQHVDVASVLLECDRVNPNIQNIYDSTPLHNAMKLRHGIAASVLLDRARVNPNIQDGEGNTILHRAVLFLNQDTASVLLKRENVDRNRGMSSLRPPTTAAESARQGPTSLLLNREDIDPDGTPQSSTLRPQNEMCRGRKAEQRTSFDRENVNVNASNRFGQSPLMFAAILGIEAIARLLASRNDIDINCKDDSGATPLSWAAYEGHEKVVKLLMEHPAVDTTSALHHAAAGGHEAVVKLLIEQASLKVNYQVAGEFDLQIVRTREPQNLAGTPLHIAAFFKREDIVKYLTTVKDVDVDARTEFGETPLHYASRSRGRDPAVAKFFVEREDVEADSKNLEGETPLHLAVQASGGFGGFATQGDDATVELLIRREDVDVNSEDLKGRTPLHLAATRASRAVIEQVLGRKKIDVSPRDHEGQTPLHNAASSGNSNAVRSLLERKADTGLENNFGLTPLALALREAEVRHQTLLSSKKDDSWKETVKLLEAAN